MTQLKSDFSLNFNDSVVNQIDSFKYEIEGGAIKESILFHSFQDFGIETSEIIYLKCPLGIENIFIRVTGSNPSKILGNIKVLGNGNLFLINPKGVILGRGVQLEFNGEFTATTAACVLFNNDFEFSAINPQNVPSNTTISLSLGFGFNFRILPDHRPAMIRVEGEGQLLETQILEAKISKGRNPSQGIQVKPQRKIYLLGGEINLDGSTIAAEGGKITMVAVEEGLVAISPDGKVNTGSVLNYTEIKLSNKSLVDVSSPPSEASVSSGSVEIIGRNIILDDSVILSQNTGSDLSGNISIEGFSSSRPSNLNIEASDVITLESEGSIKSTVQNPASELIDLGLLDRNTNALSGNITIRVPELNLINSSLSALNEGLGNAGDLNLNVDRLALNNNASISATSTSGLGGNIEANFRYLGLQGGSTISTNAGGTGNGGNITLRGENLAVLENSRISADANAGDGGRVNIDVKGLFAPPGSITANSRSGNPGSVEIGKINPLQNFATPSDNFTPTEPTFASCNNTQQPILKVASSTGIGIAPDKRIDTSIDLIPVAPNLEQPPIQEATGWEKTASGSIILVASNLPFEQYSLGYQHYQKGEYKTAIALWEQLLNQSQYIPNLAIIHSALASAYRLMGQLPSAIEYQQIALAAWQQTPNSPETIIAASIELAELYNDSGLTNYSLPLTEKILSLPSIEQNSKLKAASQQVRGNAYLIQGDWNDAIASFKESLKTAPTDLKLTQSTLNNLTTAYNEQSQQYQTQSKTASDLKQKFFASEKEQYAQKAQQEAISTVLLRSRNLRYPIDLLVLSACSTASGDPKAALGMTGIALRNGVDSIIGTLWDINDRLTAEMMTDFYLALSQGMSKAEALRQAQLKQIRVSIANRDPRLWSAFILSGS